MADFKNVELLRGYCFKVLPLVYDDSLSYYEVLCKVRESLNEVIKNTNQLPNYIEDLIKEYVTSEAIDDVLKDILANYILNVKYPPAGITPATGDGSENDTEAIQGCIDYANSKGGGIVYLPFGKYLTNPITLYDNVGIMGFDRYNTELVLAGGATSALIHGESSNCTIVNITLNGNAGNQVNSVDCIELTGGNYLLNNLEVKNGYNLVTFHGGSGGLQVGNCVFNNAGHRAFNVPGDNLAIQLTNCIFNTLSETSGDVVIHTESDNGFYSFTSFATVNSCVRAVGNNNYFMGNITNANKAITDVNNTNYYSFNGQVEKQSFILDSELTADNILMNAIKDYFVSCNIYDIDTNCYDVSCQNLNETYNVRTSKGTSGLEQLIGDKTINAVNSSEVLTGKKTLTALDSEEAVTGNKTLTAKEITTTAGNCTINVTENLIENITNSINRIAGVISENANRKVLAVDDITVDSDNPVKVGKVTQGNYFDTLAGATKEGEPYNFLIENDKTALLGENGNVYHVLDGVRNYIDNVNGDDSNEGTQDSPWKTLTPFFNQANTTKDGKTDIRCYIVSAGEYTLPPQSYNNITIHITANVDGVILNFTTSRDVKFYECHTNLKNLTIKAPNATEFAFDGGSISLTSCTFMCGLTCYAVQGFVTTCSFPTITASDSNLIINSPTLTNTDPDKDGYTFESCVIRLRGSAQNTSLTENGSTNGFIRCTNTFMQYGVTFRLTDCKYAYGLIADGSYITTNSTHWGNFASRSVNGVSATGFGTTVQTVSGFNVIDTIE